MKTTKAIIGIEAVLICWLLVLVGHHVYVAVTAWNVHRGLAQDSIDAALTPALIAGFIGISMGMLIRKLKERST